MNENNTQVITTTTNDNMITITLTYGQQQNAATEKPEITPVELDELAHEAGYLTKEEAEDLISEARQNALSDANEEEFECEANDRGYYRKDQIIDNADIDELIEAINSRLGSKLMTEEGWREQATEDGWQCPEQVAQTIADTIAELKNQIATLLQNEQLNYLQNA